MIDRLERALARAIDGGIAAVFRLGVQPADIGRHLEHALLGSRHTSMGHVIGANHYIVTMHPDDYSAFASWSEALSRELQNWLQEVAFHHGVTMIASPQVVVASDPAVERYDVQVSCEFSNGGLAGLTRSRPIVRLIPLSQHGDVIELSEPETTVGRAPGNDLILGAAEISREHARLHRQGNSLEIQDLGSRNGTWVNGVRITNHRARSGDEVAFATLRFRLDLP